MERKKTGSGGKNRASGTILSGLIYMYLEYQKEMKGKIFGEIMAEENFQI